MEVARGAARVTRLGAGVAAATAAAVLLAACGAGSSRPAGSPGGPSAPVPGVRVSSTTVVTGDHAVAPPGRFRAPLHTADMLILRQRTISPQTVRRIRHLAGVTQVEQFSWAQVSVQDHAIDVAAVDPATYRNFNTQAVGRLGTAAQFQAEWDRVADGELALRQGFSRQVDPHGYVRLGAGAGAPRIHVGAFAPQIPQVDAVVNRSWVKTLGMRPGNALLVSTGVRTPADLRHPIQRIVGGGTSVERLDVAARLGLDPHAVQTALLVGGPADAVGSYRYTVLGGGRIAPQQAWVTAHISTETMPIIGPMTCNTRMFPQLRAALEEIRAQGLASAIHPQQYGGCFVPRFIAGTTTLSNHAFGLAFDVNVPENERGTVGRIDRQVVGIFQKWGFTWGGTWRYTDPMHFELHRIVQPG